MTQKMMIIVHIISKFITDAILSNRKGTLVDAQELMSNE